MSSHELCDILKVVSNKYSPCQDICDSVERVWENCMLRGVHPAKYIKQVSYSFEGHFVQLNDLFDNDEEIVNLIMEKYTKVINKLNELARSDKNVVSMDSAI